MNRAPEVQLETALEVPETQYTRREILLRTSFLVASTLTMGKVTTAEDKKAEEDPYLTEELDAHYHAKKLKAHPRYNSFLAQKGMLDYLKALNKTEDEKSFIASVIVLFREYLKNNTSPEDLKEDAHYQDYYMGTVYGEDIKLKLNGEFRYNGLMIPQNRAIVLLAYGIHVPTQELIDAEVVAINPERDSIVTAVGNMPRRKHFQAKLAEIEAKFNANKPK